MELILVIFILSLNYVTMSNVTRYSLAQGSATFLNSLLLSATRYWNDKPTLPPTPTPTMDGMPACNSERECSRWEMADDLRLRSDATLLRPCQTLLPANKGERRSACKLPARIRCFLGWGQGRAGICSPSLWRRSSFVFFFNCACCGNESVDLMRTLNHSIMQRYLWRDDTMVESPHYDASCY